MQPDDLADAITGREIPSGLAIRVQSEQGRASQTPTAYFREHLLYVGSWGIQ
jgi:hypothetical protein